MPWPRETLVACAVLCVVSCAENQTDSAPPAKPASSSKAEGHSSTESVATDSATEASVRPSEPSQPVVIEVAPLQSGPLTFNRLLLTHDVLDREPVDPGNRYLVGDRLHLFVDATNEGSEAQTLDVRWNAINSSWETGAMSLTVEVSPRFRTWAKSPVLPHAGEFEVVVSTSDGDELIRIPFEVTRTLSSHAG